MSEIVVELDVFCGRPNPKWKLTQNEGQSLQDRLRTLPPIEETDLPETLGYRGFRLEWVDTLSGQFIVVQVSNGLVQHHRAGKMKCLIDANRELEKWLLHTAYQWLDRVLYNNLVQIIY